MITKALNRKEAIMMGDENVTPMTREEAILAGQKDLKVFTRDEYLRVNGKPQAAPEAPVLPQL